MLLGCCYCLTIVEDFYDSTNTERGTKGGPIAHAHTHTHTHFVANNMRVECEANPKSLLKWQHSHTFPQRNVSLCLTRLLDYSYGPTTSKSARPKSACASCRKFCKAVSSKVLESNSPEMYSKAYQFWMKIDEHRNI